MSKILAQAGISLSDVYDVQGSVVGVEELLSREVSLTHDMGQTLQSERLSADVRRAESTAVAQDLPFSAGLLSLPRIPCRILAIIVVTSVTSRILNCAVSVSDAGDSQEIPIWAWDGTNERTLRFVDDGSESNLITLVGDPTFSRLPSFTFGRDQPQSVESIVVRGTSSGFGAGTVQVTLLAYIAFADIAGISSYGLPIPSW